MAILRLAHSALIRNVKGSIGEIKTGEGKSFIVSTLAILLCLYGKKVDIITSNIELASRDQKNHEETFDNTNDINGMNFINNYNSNKGFGNIYFYNTFNNS